MTDSDWEVFQRDVLDVLRQYEGYFDFFERVGSLSDDSRPDCFGRITREDKKEVWVIDAKNKPEIGEDDKKRMNKYIEMLKSNPIDMGLEMSEISDYRFRSVFVTSSGKVDLEEHESVNFKALHQFLQKELVYTDMDKVIRDVSKMAERKQLSQSQARILFRSLKPFEQRIDRALESIEELEREYVGLEVKKPPLSSFDFKVPVDVVITHRSRDIAFLLDIPYSWEAVKEVDEKVEEVKERLDQLEKEVYYAAINTFEEHESKYVLQPEELRQEIRETAGIVSPEAIAEMFTPKIQTEKEYLDQGIEVRDKHNFGFRLRVETTDDTRHRIEAKVPEDAISRMKDTMMNSRKEFGKLQNRKFRQNIAITDEFEVKYGDNQESFRSYKDAVKSIYQSSVNPVLGKKVKKLAN